MGASGLMPSSALATTGSGSYSTLISSHAWRAISGVSAATAAIGSPMYLAVSPGLIMKKRSSR